MFHLSDTLNNLVAFWQGARGYADVAEYIVVHCRLVGRNMSDAAGTDYKYILLHILAPDLLILDELGFKKLPNYSADDFFEIISKRYEQGSIIITTNKSFEQWSDIFADAILASAILDRIVHYSDIIKINGPSYRAKNIKKGGGDIT